MGADAARAGRRPRESRIRPPGGGGGSAGVSGEPASRHRLLGPRREPTASRSARQTFGGEGDRWGAGGEFPARGKPHAARFPSAWYPQPGHRTSLRRGSQHLQADRPARSEMHAPRSQGWELLNHAGFFAGSEALSTIETRPPPRPKLHSRGLLAARTLGSRDWDPLRPRNGEEEANTEVTSPRLAGADLVWKFGVWVCAALPEGDGGDRSQ